MTTRRGTSNANARGGVYDREGTGMKLTERAIAQCFRAWFEATRMAEKTASPAMRRVYTRKAIRVAAHAAFIAARRGLR